MGVLLLFWYQLQVPNAPRRYCQTLLSLHLGEHLTLVAISRERKRLGFSKKKMMYWSARRNEASRVAFWANGPFDGVYICLPRSHKLVTDTTVFTGANNVLPGVHGERGVAGIAGVPVEYTLDIDEVCASSASPSHCD